MKDRKNIQIRNAKRAELGDLVEIYNQAILARGKTAHETVFQVCGRIDWFESHTPNRYPILVAERDSKVVGYLSISPYREGRKSLETTIELSYYVHSDHHRKGVGGALLEAGIETAATLGFETAICILLSGNEASISLLQKFRFQLWATLPSVAIIDGRYFDHLYFGKRIRTLSKGEN